MLTEEDDSGCAAADACVYWVEALVLAVATEARLFAAPPTREKIEEVTFVTAVGRRRAQFCVSFRSNE